jgi:hypothetical protein
MVIITLVSDTEVVTSYMIKEATAEYRCNKVSDILDDKETDLAAVKPSH